MPPQCYRCQEFFHHSRFCARALKCLKCSGGHLTSECTKAGTGYSSPRHSHAFHTYRTNAILDIGFAVNLSHTEVFTINEHISDQNPVIFDSITNNVLPPILRTLKSTNWTKFQEIIYHNIPGNPQIDDLDLAVQNCTSNVSNATCASTSTRIINTPHLRLPENIRELIRAKNRLRKLWNNKRYPPYKREVNALIRHIRSVIQDHKNRIWKNFLLTLNPEDSSLYNLHRKFSKRHTPFPPLHGSGGMAYSDFEKVEAFEDTLEVTFQENEEPFRDDKIEAVENLVNHFFDNFTTSTSPLTSASEALLKKLQNRKVAGPDQIRNIALKYLTLNAITLLTKLYNQCLIKKHFPTQWKQANVIMLAKPNKNRTFPQGYRPIRLINATAKIFERIILTRIKSHCNAIDCIPPEQCGFWEGHSTLHQLIRVTNIINEGFAHKFYTVGVFLDVKRAFDKMRHDGLTYKLIKLQFPDYLIKIIHNFLHNRTFRIRLNNIYSNTGSCLSGVPQGSVLSPYLYNIYTPDFPQHSTVSTCLFVDYSAVLSQGVQLKYTIKAIQNFLDKLETWLTHWRIAINVDKSQTIIFRKWGVIDLPFQLTHFDDNIQWVSVVKYLGLHIDSRLTFKKHIDYLVEKFWGRIHLAISLVGRRSPLSLENKKQNQWQKKKGQLSLDELESAEIQLIRSVQTQSFTDKKLISNLSVFRDDSNIIHVKTQITERTDAPNILSPILPPNNCIFTQRLIEHFHLKNNHTGTQLLLSIKREEYWMVGGRRTVRKIWNACVKCRRFRSKSPMTDLASLPSDRVKDSAVYEVVGADLTGLLYVKRGDKVWIVLYTCAIYRALHLELVSFLSTDAFLLFFRRFVVRRGRSRIIYSDNGNNYRGTYNKLVCIDWNEVSRYVAIQRITWKFIPPTTAWWGGFWERLVRTVKELLRRTLWKTIFTYEELLFCANVKKLLIHVH
ncbi:probable RNA-directed DNA polymerase from transposon X-element [Trichonephila clavipes]|nr:probable RNA-directed DNA polymerase from transposon X-element [Trichonephila clavipes]